MFNERELEIIIKAQDKASSVFKKLKDRVKSLTTSTFSLLNPFSSLEKALAVIGGTAGAGMLAKSFIDTASAFEQFNTQLVTITGSAQAAKQAMGWITTFTAKTPYELDEVTNAFIKLRNYGIDPTNGTLRVLGDTASSMGKSLDDAVEALADAMTGEFERLKEFGIKAKATADQVTFYYMKAGQQMAVTVKNSAEEIQKALLSIWSDKFAGGMERMSHTLKGMLSNLADYWTLFKNEVMQSGVFAYIKAVVQAILDKVNELKKSGKFDEWAKRTGEAITKAFEGAVITLAQVPLYLQEAKVKFIEFFRFLSEHNRIISIILESAGAALFMRGKVGAGMQLFAAGVGVKNMGQYAEQLKQAEIENKKALQELEKQAQNTQNFFLKVHKLAEKYQQEQESVAKSTKALANSQKDLSKATSNATQNIQQQTQALQAFQQKIKGILEDLRWQQMTPEQRYAEIRNKLSDLRIKALSEGDVEAAKEYVETFQKYMDLLSQFEGKENVMEEFRNTLQDLEDISGQPLQVDVDTDTLSTASQSVSDLKNEIEDIKNLLPIEITAVDKATKTIQQIKKELEAIKTFTVTVKIKTERLSDELSKAIRRGQVDLSGGQVG